MNLTTDTASAVLRVASVATVCLFAMGSRAYAGVIVDDTWSDGYQLKVKATNKLRITRTAQTLELTAHDLARLGETNLTRIHIRDAAGKEVLCQAVDTDYEPYHRPDAVVFQSNFAPGETLAFTVGSGKAQEHVWSDFKAYGRFVRERFDDFAWENDRIAHRTYGKALETWKGEPLTSSAIDIWSKRTSRLVIDDWYMTGHYHTDTGEGCDAYSAGTSRGCGGTGLWADNQLWVSRNFVDSRVLANGPIRVMFELVYEPFEVNGTKISEVKRITLDASSQLDHFQNFYRVHGSTNPAPLTVGIGFKRIQGARKEFKPENGSLVVWEPMAKNLGMQGLAAIVNPKALEGQAEDKLNHLLLAKTDTNCVFSYWAGFAWDKAGLFTNAEAWQRYIDQFTQELQSPIEVSVAAE
jgi:hypothetical protein